MIKNKRFRLARKLGRNPKNWKVGLVLAGCFLLGPSMVSQGNRVLDLQLIQDSFGAICASTCTQSINSTGTIDPAIELAKQPAHEQRSDLRIEDPFMDAGGTMLSLMFTVNTDKSG